VGHISFFSYTAPLLRLFIAAFWSAAICGCHRKTLVFSEKTSTFASANHIFLQLLLSVLNKATAFRKGMRRVVGV
jgi:hypothetical protein